MASHPRLCAVPGCYGAGGIGSGGIRIPLCCARLAAKPGGRVVKQCKERRAPENRQHMEVSWCRPRRTWKRQWNSMGGGNMAEGMMDRL